MENKERLEEREKHIDKAVELDKDIKSKTAELNQIKAELQAEALQLMENRGSKYVEYFGTGSSVVVCYKEKFEIDNLPMLKAVFGDVVNDKIKREESIKITIDTKFKEALIALYNEDFANNDLQSMLMQKGLGMKEAKAALKKLKGDYAKDLKVLRSFGVNVADGAEEELDAIRQAKNYEIIEKFVEPEMLDFKKLKRAISVEETLSIGLVYDAGEV